MSTKTALTESNTASDIQRTLLNISTTSHWINDKQRLFFKEHDLTPQQFTIIRLLDEASPNALTINILKEQIMDHQCDVSRIVNRLESKNFITRQVNPNDRRSADVRLTEEGKSLFNQIMSRYHKIEETLDHLDYHELDQLNHLLEKIRNKR